jgi:pimeloyl-ACP methyl ester carboxylesterase
VDHQTWRKQQQSVRVDTEHHEFDAAYYEHGSGDPVTVLLHGIPTWSFLYREVIGGLNHVVVPDMPGYGYTRHRGVGGYDRSVRAQEEFLISFLDALELDSANVVGHDIGGAVALRLAVHTDLVDRLVLSNATTHDAWPFEDMNSLGEPFAARNWTYRGVEDTLRSMFSEGTYDDSRATETFVDGLIAPFVDPKRPVAALARNASALNTNHTLELIGSLDQITAPALLLWGVPGSKQHVGYAERLADNISATERNYLKDAYHWVMQDRPEEYQDGLESFLS